MGPSDPDIDPFLTPLEAEGDRAESTTDLVGARLGKYEILKRLSVGGMAEIFLARAAAISGFHKLVVVKRILPQLAAQPEFVEMFLDEAKISATLQHPNIVQTYDVAAVGGSYFIAMEFLQGVDLNALLRTVKKRRDRIPTEHAVQILISLLAGLQYAHDKDGFDGKPLKIVHRDVTPANVIVTYEGSVKLLDFGIARAATRAETRSGTLKGKIHYMSPEQAQGQPIDRRADVYAAGILLWELTMLRRLYKAGTDYQVLNEVVNGTVPRPSALDPTYDRELETIVMRALERDPQKRYATAQAMQNDLESYAKKRGLFLSASSLKQYLGELFGDRISAWKKAQAEGKPMPEMVIDYEDEDEEVPPPPMAAVAPASEPPAALPPAALPPPSLEAARTRSRFRLARAPLVIGASVMAATVFASTAVLWPRHPKPQIAIVRAADKPRPALPLPVPPPAAPAPGKLSITTHPHGAALILDGKRLAQASNATVDLDAGEHTLIVEKKGFQSLQRKLAVEAGSESKLTFDLRRGSAPVVAPAPAAIARPAPPPPPPPAPVVMKGDGTLAITSSPWCAVDIDGSSRGQTPVKLTVPAGSHKITLSNPEYGIKRQLIVVVHPNETVRKSLEFTR